MAEGQTNRFHKFASVIKDAVFLASLIVALSTAIGSFAFSLAWPRLIHQLQKELNVVTREDFQAMQNHITQLTGEDRIIKMPSGHSYVDEPVSAGQKIKLTIVMARTKRGKPCTFEMATPLFKDSRDIPLSGKPVEPIKQLGVEYSRLNLSLETPADLMPGRVGVSLSMRFSCPFGSNGDYISAFDETDTIFFQLDP